MTREEAIEILKNTPFICPSAVDIDRALHMAISALEQEPCEDAISRILQRMWNCKGKHTTSIDKVKMEQIIREELPSVQPKPIECEDAISREAAVEAIDKWYENNRGEAFFDDYIEDLIIAVTYLPSVQPSRKDNIECEWAKMVNDTEVIPRRIEFEFSDGTRKRVLYTEEVIKHDMRGDTDTDSN